MKFEETEVMGIFNALYGMRLPMCKNLEETKGKCVFSVDDFDLLKGHPALTIDSNTKRIARNLINADLKSGSQPNSKFLRMIHVQVAITAPLYWWKEMDTYKVGTTSNSTSTMHTLTKNPITLDCFEMSDFKNFELEGDTTLKDAWEYLVDILERFRKTYNTTKDETEKKRIWKEIIRLLPMSWLQTRMWDADYSVLRNIYHWRKNHKLTEWREFCKWIETLPHFEEFIK